MEASAKRYIDRKNIHEIRPSNAADPSSTLVANSVGIKGDRSEGRAACIRLQVWQGHAQPTVIAATLAQSAPRRPEGYTLRGAWDWVPFRHHKLYGKSESAVSSLGNLLATHSRSHKMEHFNRKTYGTATTQKQKQLGGCCSNTHPSSVEERSSNVITIRLAPLMLRNSSSFVSDS